MVNFDVTRIKTGVTTIVSGSLSVRLIAKLAVASKRLSTFYTIKTLKLEWRNYSFDKLYTDYRFCEWLSCLSCIKIKVYGNCQFKDRLIRNMFYRNTSEIGTYQNNFFSSEPKLESCFSSTNAHLSKHNLQSGYGSIGLSLYFFSLRDRRNQFKHYFRFRLISID